MNSSLKYTRSIIYLIPFIFLSCSQSPGHNPRASFDNLPVAEIKLISEFDQSGDYYFQFLSQTSIPLPGGDVILADRGGEFIIQVNPQGEFVKTVARDGKGPVKFRIPYH